MRHDADELRLGIGDFADDLDQIEQSELSLGIHVDLRMNVPGIVRRRPDQQGSCPRAARPARMEKRRPAEA
jgi:hypothetical protein